mgnify:CR=1 FL=1
MKLEDIALDWKTSQKLKDAGIEIETYAYWQVGSVTGRIVLHAHRIDESSIPAPTLEELFNIMAGHLKVHDINEYILTHENPKQAAAAMLLWLKKQ